MLSQSASACAAKRQIIGCQRLTSQLRTAAVALLLILPGTALAQVVYTQSFEGGVIPAEWSVPPAASTGWSVTNITAADGSLSIQTNSLQRFDSARVTWTLTPPYARLDFQHYWNTKPGEPFEVFVNGELAYSSTNTPRGWFPATVDLTGVANAI